MGTNFYFKTKVKEFAKQFDDYETSDRGDDLHYEIHLAKTSYGWLPLFQSHTNMVNSVKDIERLYKENWPDVIIIDEYDDEYDWDGFKKRVLEFNGGIDGVMEKTPITNNTPGTHYYDPNLPKATPISHFDYKGYDTLTLFKDPEGYEFETRTFS